MVWTNKRRLRGGVVVSPMVQPLQVPERGDGPRTFPFSFVYKALKSLFGHPLDKRRMLHIQAP